MSKERSRVYAGVHLWIVELTFGDGSAALGTQAFSEHKKARDFIDSHGPGTVRCWFKPNGSPDFILELWQVWKPESTELSIAR